jgi:hypothetical protein
VVCGASWADDRDYIVLRSSLVCLTVLRLGEFYGGFFTLQVCNCYSYVGLSWLSIWAGRICELIHIREAGDTLKLKLGWFLDVYAKSSCMAIRLSICVSKNIRYQRSSRREMHLRSLVFVIFWFYPCGTKPDLSR